uniref:Uncharacterized protein n=1 Tax=uncultured bacterium A1Q1_fos_91 TaxID=1256591 RepID=L7VVE8_9BACT|nr:hypothetical protein [uncultured bacterium A1Q1_fos_91]
MVSRLEHSLRAHAAAALCVATLCAQPVVAPSPARACSGPFFVDIATVPRTGDTGVPLNALIRVDDRLRDRASLDVELVPTGAAGDTITLTLTLDADSGYFVGLPSAPLAAMTSYDVRLARETFCAVATASLSLLPPECGAGVVDDSTVVIASFVTGDAADQDAPVIGAGVPTVGFGERLVCDSVGACCSMFSVRIVEADASAWEASDDVAVAGYHVYRDGEFVSSFRSDPFPASGWQGCSGTPPSTDLQPGSYQVVAEDYAGRVSAASAPVMVGNGCGDDGAAQCTVRVTPRRSRAPAAFLWGVLGLAVLRTRRR